MEKVNSAWMHHAWEMIIYDSRMGNTKLVAKAIGGGERVASLDAEVKRG